MCACNHQATAIFFSVEAVTGTTVIGFAGWTGVNSGSCGCLQRDVFRHLGNGFTLLCKFRVGNNNGPGTPCLGRSFVYNHMAPFVGHHEYRPVQANAPVTFQYVGPARCYGGLREPILTVFTIIMCNEISTTPVNLVVTPQLRHDPQNSWSVSGQDPVSRGGKRVCTSLDQTQLVQNAREGQTLYCNFIADGFMIRCNYENFRLEPLYTAHLQLWLLWCRVRGHFQFAVSFVCTTG